MAALFFVGLCAAICLEYFAVYLFSSVAWYSFFHFAHGTEATGGGDVLILAFNKESN